MGSSTDLAMKSVKLSEDHGADSRQMLGEITTLASRRAHSGDSPKASSVFRKLQKPDLRQTKKAACVKFPGRVMNFACFPDAASPDARGNLRKSDILEYERKRFFCCSFIRDGFYKKGPIYKN